MSVPLPDRPDLRQLRRQAKELRDAARGGEPGAVDRVRRGYRGAPPGGVTLAAAQLVIARELGFTSWPRLKAAVEARAAAGELAAGGPLAEALAEAGPLAAALVAASVERRPAEAAAILAAHPDIAAASIHAAAVLGDAAAVRAILAADPAAAQATDAARGWPPLLYACYSRWHQADPARAADLAEVVALLLGAGASPYTNDGGRRAYHSALKGSVEVNNPAITRLLLDAGASPDDGQCIGEAAAHRDHRCLELLLSAGARVAGTWAIGAAVYAGDPEAVSLLAAAIRGAAAQPAEAAGQAEHEADARPDAAAREATEMLADAAAEASPQVVAALLDAGADPRATDPETGMSALRRAVRAGRAQTAALLARRGAPDDSTAVDRLIGAGRRGDRAAAGRLLAGDPGLPGRLTAEDRAAIVDAAAGPAAAVALLVDLGFSPADRNAFGEQPLHNAAYHGNAEVVRLLIDAGADLDARDARFDAAPLAYATVGSGEQAGRPGRWAETVRLLIAAGAAREGAWIAGKPPSEEITALLRTYGIAPDDESGTDDEPGPGDRSGLGGEPGHEGDGAACAPGLIGTGVMADVARHLAAAYRSLDLELLGSLLHPAVQWTGLCRTSAEVLDWYRRSLADGIRPALESVEVDRDAVVVGMTLSRPAVGTRPAPPERLYQVFRVDDGQVVEIRGYPDRARALARP
ncbi:MAG TPA: ankyrin repeat domain-containing protein [Streptosporangiaceae bacterium]|nr:ankyrin repeat domain-containing protein [Streptosporangiaceae bacterium]